MRGGRLNSYELRVLEDLDMARRSIGPGAAEHFGRVDDVGAIVGAEEINHLDGRVLCQEQRASEMNARAPWQGYGRVGEEGSMGVAARGQAPASGT